MKLYYFYTLSEKNSDEIRYVGVTTRSNLQERFSEHKYKANSKNRSAPVHKWMYSKFLKNIEIVINQIDFCEKSVWEEKEKYWIQYYRNLGHRLLNLQQGGSGVITKEMRDIDGRTRSIEAHKKPIAAYNELGEEIYRFDSTVEAMKFFGLKSKSTIGWALKYPNRKSVGYYWKFLEKKYTINVPKRNSEYNKRIIVYRLDKNKNMLKKYESVRQIFKDLFLTNSGSYFKKYILDKNRIWNDSYWISENVYDKTLRYSQAVSES